MSAPAYTAVIRRDGEWWIGWIEARRGESGGRRRAESGAITGGVAAGVVVCGTMLIIAVFFYLMLNFPQGSSGPIA